MNIELCMSFKPTGLFGIIGNYLLLLLLLLSLSSLAGAQDDPDGDAKLKAMRTDIEALILPGSSGNTASIAFAKKYNVSQDKLEQLAAPNRTTKYTGEQYKELWLNFLCNAEVYTVIGAIVWRVRADMDGWDVSSQVPPCYLETYCLEYSLHCNHWKWQQGCLASKCPHCCVRHDP